MIKTKFRRPGEATARYVRKGAAGYEWCEQSIKDSRYDLAQGTCDAEDLTPEIIAMCDAHTGAFYACAWPLP